MPAGPRTRYLDGLRGLAALQVILHHTYLTVYPLNQGVYPTGLTKLATSSMMLSGLGVTVFIVLSGYTLSMSAHRRGWALPDGPMPFLRRRARRLLPAYYVVLVASILLGLTVLREQTGAHWDISVPFSGIDVLGHLLVAQDVIGQPYAINHPLWSIALTFHLYLLFPVLLLCAARWGVGRVAAWALALTTPIAVAAFLNVEALFIVRQLQFVGVFAAGMATLAIVRADGVVTIRGRERRPPWLGLAIGLFVVWAAAPLNHLNHVPFALGVCCLLVGLGTGSLTSLRRLLEWRGIVWMGAISLSLYLVHAPIVHGAWLTALRPAGHGVGDIRTLLLLLPLAVGASLLGGWAFHRYVERPLAPAGVAAPVPAEVAPAPERAR